MDSKELQGWVSVAVYAAFLGFMCYSWNKQQSKLAAEWAETRRIIFATANMPKEED